MKETFKKIFKTLGQIDNLIKVIAIIVAALTAFFGIRNNETSVTLAGIVSILGLIALAQILQSHSDMERDRIIREIQTHLEDAEIGSSPPLKTKAEANITTLAPDGKDYIIIGRSIIYLSEYIDFFHIRHDEGATLKLVVLNISNRSLIDDAWYQSELSSKSGVAAYWKMGMEAAEAIAKNLKSEGQLRIKLIDYVSPFYIEAADIDRSDGVIIIEFVPPFQSPGERPRLVLKRKAHPLWFNYFRVVIDAIWNDKNAKPFQIPTKKIRKSHIKPGGINDNT